MVQGPRRTYRIPRQRGSFAISRARLRPIRPKIENQADLISFCRKSEHELLRTFGVLIDPHSTKQEILSISNRASRKFFSAVEVRDAYWLIEGIKDCFTPAEARTMLEAGNLLQRFVGAVRTEFSTTELVEMLRQHGDSEDISVIADSEITFGSVISRVAYEQLRESDLAPADLKELGQQGGFYRLFLVAEHPNTPVDVLFAIQASIVDKPEASEILIKAQQNISNRGLGLLRPLLDPELHPQAAEFHDDSSRSTAKALDFIRNIQNFPDVLEQIESEMEADESDHVSYSKKRLFSADARKALEAAQRLDFQFTHG